MIDLLVAAGFFVVTAIVRYIDGSDYRPKGSNILCIALPVLAGLWAAWPVHFSAQSFLQQSPLLIPVLVSSWLLVRGMPGFDHWLPHTRTDGKKMTGMLAGFSLPTALASLLFLAASFQFHGQLPSLMPAIAFGASGLVLAATYVLLTQIEDHPTWRLPFTAEVAGRVSYGFIPATLSLL